MSGGEGMVSARFTPWRLSTRRSGFAPSLPFCRPISNTVNPRGCRCSRPAIELLHCFGLALLGQWPVPWEGCHKIGSFLFGAIFQGCFLSLCSRFL